jgi:hypothetical protein
MSANRRIFFNDGEGVDSGDLNAIVSHGLKQIDDRDFGSAIDALVVNPSGYSAAYAANGTAQIFVRGMALGVRASSANLDVTFLPGMVVINPASGTPGSLADNVRALTSYLFAGQTVTLAAPAAADRWDLVTAPITSLETDDGSESRIIQAPAPSFSQSVQSVNKRLSLPTTLLQVTQGAEGGGIPATPAGRARVSAIKVRFGSAGIGTSLANLHADVIDYTVPLGRRRVMTPGSKSIGEGTFSPSTLPLQCSISSGDEAFFLPGDLTGDPSSRVVGIVVAHHAGGGSFAADVVRMTFAGGANDVVEAIPVGTLDGTSRCIEFAPTAPVWCNGSPSGRAVDQHQGTPVPSWSNGFRQQTAAVRITGTSGVADIEGVIFLLASAP